MTEDFQSFVRSLPKVELHLHLEGSVSPGTLRELLRAKGRLKRETEAWIKARTEQRYRYRNFADFLQAFKLVTLLLETPADYALATKRLLEELEAQGVRYAEIILAAGVILWKKQPVEAVFEAVSAAARECHIQVKWIFDAIRHFGPEHVREVAHWAGRLRSRGVVALGIGGDEAKGPARLFPKAYREAQDMGLHLVAHAGEAAGPESIRDAVELLGVERIGHGLTAARDPGVMALLRERRIPLEVCLSSNVSTGLLNRIEEHPLKELFRNGVIVTLNSDDPAMFGTSLEREFLLAALHFELSRAQIVELSANAIRASFMDETEKGILLAALADW